MSLMLDYKEIIDKNKAALCGFIYFLVIKINYLIGCVSLQEYIFQTGHGMV